LEIVSQLSAVGFIYLFIYPPSIPQSLALTAYSDGNIFMSLLYMRSVK